MVSQGAQEKRERAGREREAKTVRAAKAVSDTPDVIIDLEQLVERPAQLKVADDETYPFRLWDMFSLLDQKSIERQWKRIIAIENTESITEEESQERETLARTVLERICEIPKKATQQLTVAQALEACGGYFGLQQARQRVRPILLAMMGANPISANSPSASMPDGHEQEALQSG